MNVGYIGLGAMGSALARNLLGKFPVKVWDLNQRAVESLVSLGAESAETAAQIARSCEVIVLCLPRSANVEEVIFGPQGLAAELKAGQLIIDQTSGIPHETRHMATRLAELGVAMVDAPVAGGVPSALAGTITIMASGTDAAYEQALAVLNAISPKVYRCSNRVGDAQAMKLVNNTINAGYRMATLEIIALGRSIGLSLEAMTDALNDSHAQNFTSRQLLTAVVEGRPSSDFALTLMVKDLNQALSLGMAVESAMPLAAVARGTMQEGVHLLGGHATLDDVVPLVEKLYGVDLRGPTLAPSDTGAYDLIERFRLIVDGVAACNRLVVYENAVLGVKLNLSTTAMGKIINAGSGWSRESERILGSFGTQTPTGLTSLRQALADLKALARWGHKVGAPLVLVNQALAIYQVCVNGSAPDATIDELTRYYESTSGVTLKHLQPAHHGAAAPVV